MNSRSFGRLSWPRQHDRIPVRLLQLPPYFFAAASLFFTSDKDQFRENLARSGHRPLALDLAGGVPRPERRDVWHRLRSYMLRFGKVAADRFIRIKSLRRRRSHQPPVIHEHKATRVLGERSKRSRSQNRSVL